MLSKEEKKAINHQFWNDFKLHMRGIPSANGRKMNWLTYPTDLKILFVRLEATAKYARLNFDLQVKDEAIRSIVWEQLGELKAVLRASMNGDEGNWIYDHSNELLSNYSTIYWELPNVNYLKESDRVVIFDFFKEKLIGFDDFYQNFKDILIQLVK